MFHHDAAQRLTSRVTRQGVVRRANHPAPCRERHCVERRRDVPGVPRKGFVKGWMAKSWRPEMGGRARWLDPDAPSPSTESESAHGLSRSYQQNRVGNESRARGGLRVVVVRQHVVDGLQIANNMKLDVAIPATLTESDKSVPDARADSRPR